MTERDLMMEDGVTPSQKRIKSFLGMVMFYQRFIQNCSSIAKPFFTLTAAPKGQKNHRTKLSAFRKLSPSDWKKEQQDSFKQLKSALLESVVLAHPDFNRPFILSTDASLDGLGAVLSQIPEGETKARPVAFASKALTYAQSNYPAHRLEFLALKWSVCDKFSHWLKGHSFTVWMDNNPLTYILTKPRLDACEQRWVAKLAPYNFSIQYIPGSKNVVADATTLCPRTYDVSAVLESQTKWSAGPKDMVHYWLTQDVQNLAPAGQSALPVFTQRELQDKQLEDPVLARVLSYVARGRRPSRRERTKEMSRILKTLKQWEKLKMLDGILYRVCKDQLTGKKRWQYVVPASLTEQVLLGVPGHQGQARTLYLARERFFWVDMERDVREYVKCCKRCVVSKTPEPEARAPLESVKTTTSVPYVVVSKDPRCHTFRVRNTSTGQEKVVHPNLMLQANFLPLQQEENESCHEGSLFSQKQSDETLTENSTPQKDPPETERIVEWVASLPATDESVGGRSDTGDLESAVDPGEPERLTNNQDQEIENDCPLFDSHIIPTDSTDTQDGVRADVIMPGARERHRAISTVSISSAPPNVSEVVTQVRTRVGRNKLKSETIIPSMCDRVSVVSGRLPFEVYTIATLSYELFNQSTLFF
ncbi:hypothetical protein QQF64_023390 [Cirrhinus molitorella]|uniref:Gypsy retrotransposon integrase-like protein 1 n=1 Tax=Cirrhinus molitorella TaxID=172907 RepID=A0ABR3L531_9TELE